MCSTQPHQDLDSELNAQLVHCCSWSLARNRGGDGGRESRLRNHVWISLPPCTPFSSFLFLVTSTEEQLRLQLVERLIVRSELELRQNALEEAGTPKMCIDMRRHVEPALYVCMCIHHTYRAGFVHIKLTLWRFAATIPSIDQWVSR